MALNLSRAAINPLAHQEVCCFAPFGLRYAPASSAALPARTYRHKSRLSLCYSGLRDNDRNCREVVGIARNQTLKYQTPFAFHAAIDNQSSLDSMYPCKRFKFFFQIP